VCRKRIILLYVSDKLKMSTAGSASDGKGEPIGRKRMLRSASTKTDNPRTAWCPVILKTKNCLEVHLLWKESRNTIKLYQTEEKKDFGRIKAAEFVKERNKKGNLNDYYKVMNEYGDEIYFRSTLLSPALIGSNSFSKMMMELRCESGGDIKLASYLGCLSQSQGFSHHDSNRDIKGEAAFDKDEQERFDNFLKAAVENATCATVDRNEAVEAIAKKTNRKKKSSEKPKVKSKQSKLENFFSRELHDPKGVEREHVEGFQARADVHIDNLEVCTEVLLPIDEWKVKMLAKEMSERFDPSKMTLTVVPLDPEAFLIGSDKPLNFVVVHGRHR
jgi:hypothetical protein